MKLGLIAGMVDEAACLKVIPQAKRPSIRCSGAITANAFSLSQELIEDGCDALISFGMAGGLSSELKPGDIVISSHVISENDRWNADVAWVAALILQLELENINVWHGSVFGSDTPVTSPTKKAYFAASTDAIIVDMESHAVARAAKEAGKKFIIVRVVADTYDRAIPSWIIGGIRENGCVDKLAMVLGALTHPWDIPALIRLASDSRKAKESLSRVALISSPLFSFSPLR